LRDQHFSSVFVDFVAQMLAWISSLLILWSLSAANYARSYKSELGFVFEEPVQQSLLLTVHNISRLSIKVQLWSSLEADLIREQLRMCFTEFSAEYDAVEDKKSCTDSSAFAIDEFKCGTHLLGFTLESGSDKVLDEKLMVVDVVNAAWLREDVEGGDLARSLDSLAPHLTRLDYLYYRNSQLSQLTNVSDTTHGADEFIVLASTGGLVVPSTASDTSSALSPAMKSVALFARLAPTLVPSDRFYDWLCDHATFTAAGVDLEVVAPEPGKLISTSAALYQI
jgi:hypothetical protein